MACIHSFLLHTQDLIRLVTFVPSPGKHHAMQRSVLTCPIRYQLQGTLVDDVLYALDLAVLSGCTRRTHEVHLLQILLCARGHTIGAFAALGYPYATEKSVSPGLWHCLTAVLKLQVLASAAPGHT